MEPDTLNLLLAALGALMIVVLVCLVVLLRRRGRGDEVAEKLLREQMAAQKTASEQQLAAQHDAAEKRIADMKATYERMIEDTKASLETRLNEERDEQTKTLEAIRAHHAEEKAELMAHASQEKAELTARAEKELSDLAERTSKEKADMQERSAKEKAALLASHEEALKTQKEQLETQMNLFRTNLQTQTGEMLRRHQDELREGNDKQMEQLMRPLKEQLGELEKQLNRTREDSAAKDARMKEMLDQFAQRAVDMGHATNKLTNAMLSNGKVHGDWGEQVLERILENSGMKEGTHYLRQESTPDENGCQQRPDIIILCPGERRIVIDSKVSLTAYAECLAATTTEDRQRYEQENLRSVRSQVDNLARKAYNKLDPNNFRSVLMFIPNEGAYFLAMHSDPSLGQYAFDKGVVILTPTNLMLTLQLVESMWQKANEEKNVQEILTTAGALYEKFVGFSEDMQLIRKSLQQADGALSSAVNKLTDGKGNVVRRIERLKDLGVKYNKSKKISEVLTNEISSEISNENEDEDENALPLAIDDNVSDGAE